MPIINKISELFAKLKDGSGNSITSTDLGGGKRGLDISGSMAVDPDDRFTFDDSGNLKVVAKPDAPPGTTPVSIFYYDKHNNTSWTEYEIPQGKKLVIQTFTVGAGRSNMGTIAEIRDRGLDDNQWDLVCLPLFVNGSTQQIVVNKELPASSSGTRWIEMLVINVQKRYAGGEIIGYLEDL